MMNLVLTILFTMEMLLKHVALGVLGYWSSGFNCLDGFIVAASLVDIALQHLGEEKAMTAALGAIDISYWSTQASLGCLGEAGKEREKEGDSIHEAESLTLSGELEPTRRHI